MNHTFAATIAPIFDLSGRVAVVTGGAVGMGKASGLALAAAGARVILADDAERIAALDIAALPAGTETAIVDVTDEASVDTLVAGVAGRHAGIDILVNAAVLNHNRAILETSVAEWDRVQAINLRSAFLATRAAVPAMRVRGGGRIVNLSTIGGVHPVLNGNGAYSSARAGLNQFTRNCALDFAADGITANAVLPGAIASETIAADFRPTGPGADPMRHLHGRGVPADVVGLVLLLAGPAGRFISGQSIAVDGGFLVS